MIDFTQLISTLSDSDMWWIRSIALAFAAVLTKIVVYKIIGRFEKLSAVTQNVWDDVFVGMFKRLSGITIYGITLIYLVGAILQNYDIVKFESTFKWMALFSWFALGWAGITLANLAHDKLENDSASEIDQGFIDAASKIVKVIAITISILGICSTLGVSPSGILAFGGVGGLALGFAAKDLLSNLFGGLAIYLDRPFSKGDWIKSPDKEIEGTVEHIGWRVTRIRTFAKRPLYVPNSTFTQITVENPSRMTHRRIHERIALRYSDIGKIDVITQRVKEMLENDPAIDTTQTLMVNFDKYADSTVEFFIYAFLKDTDWQRYHASLQDVLIRVRNIVEEEGADFAYPTRTIYIEQEGK